MKKCDYYANPNYKITQEDLLERLKYYKMVYHSDDRLHLLSFILLQDSVFQPKGFFDKFEKNTLLNDIIKYNICHRAIQVIKQLDELEHSQLLAHFYDNDLSIRYCFDEEDSFEVFHASFPTPFSVLTERPHIVLYDIDATWQRPMACSPELSQKLVSYYQDPLPSIFQNGKPHHDFLTDLSLQIHAFYERQKQQIMDRLEKERMFYEQYGDKQWEIRNTIALALLDDWGIPTFELDSSKYLTKKLSWIDLYQNKTR